MGEGVPLPHMYLPCFIIYLFNGPTKEYPHIFSSNSSPVLLLLLSEKVYFFSPCLL